MASETAEASVDPVQEKSGPVASADAPVAAEATQAPDTAVEVRTKPQQAVADADTKAAKAEPAPQADATADTVSTRDVHVTVLELPERFTGKVTAVRQLIRNRQLLAIDGTMVFETDRARQSGIQVGDDVRVQHSSSLFGRRFRISGPSRAAVTGLRLRCEHLEPGQDTRRKCAAMLPADDSS